MLPGTTRSSTSFTSCHKGTSHRPDDLRHGIHRLLRLPQSHPVQVAVGDPAPHHVRSEEHTSELQSRGHLVCRLLLEKKKRTPQHQQTPMNRVCLTLLLLLLQWYIASHSW